MLDSFKRRWLNKIDKIQFQKIHNWGTFESSETPPCLAPYKYITILTNGDVVPCCIDYEGKKVMGNITSQSLSDIWNSEKYFNFRKDALSLNKKNELCKKCTVPLTGISNYFLLLKYRYFRK